ncbi:MULTISPECIES: TIGR02221 family CRISPR-associated protein [Bacillaceae]|uniref:TIGR02221 family CRISPR-associated protein n=1 Tax=Bacillaceae TaxID=186817 RepID=UPI001374EA45|nr:MULTISPECIES: TIGR02221 family CRISPR-associated protein [Bacillaceae]MCB5936075.1 TIGR02221 family CRISPR-associated protein [Bacillus sp. DFI.2.34]MCB7077424.1 TIGR02221 family CRISPR-associated protein [Caldibacillus thermoamylovorans]
MAKILISPLGKGIQENVKTTAGGKYIKTTYKFGDSDKGYDTSFITSALSEHLQLDKIFMIGTDQSMWEEVYYYFGEVKENSYGEDVYLELDEKKSKGRLTEADLTCVNEAIDRYLKKMNPSATGGSSCKLIQNGKNAEELTENFLIFMEFSRLIEPGDEVYLDITHSFRSIPLFLFVLIDFVQTLRKDENIKLSGVYYGMLEAKSDNVTPVVDLKALFEVPQWTRGVYEFIHYGHAELLAQLIDHESYKASLKNISDLADLNHIKSLKSKVDQFHSDFKQGYEHKNGLPIFPYLKPHLNRFFEYFAGADTDAKFQFQLAKWFFDHKRYANGYICLAESMITHVAYVYSKVERNVEVGELTVRDNIKRLINSYLQTNSNEHYQKMHNLYKEVSKIRNNIAHAGFLSKDNSEDVITKTNQFIKETEKLFFSSNGNRLIKKLPREYPYYKL